MCCCTAKWNSWQVGRNPRLAILEAAAVSSTWYPKISFLQMARHRKSSLCGRDLAGFDEFIQKKSHITLRSCLLALCFDLATLFEIAVCIVQDKNKISTLLKTWIEVWKSLVAATRKYMRRYPPKGCPFYRLATTRNKPFTLSCAKPSVGPRISLNSFRTDIWFFVFQCQKSPIAVFTMVRLGARFDWKLRFRCRRFNLNEICGRLLTRSRTWF